MEPGLPLNSHIFKKCVENLLFFIINLKRISCHVACIQLSFLHITFYSYTEMQNRTYLLVKTKPHFQYTI